MGFLPVNLNVNGRTCLVIGGGDVGLRKVRGLFESGAKVRLVSRQLAPELREMAGAGQIEYLGPEFSPEYLDGAALVYAATDDRALNERISREAQARNIWINVVDQPDLCTFIVPASIRRGDLTVSISTGGASPALAARIRRDLEESFGPEYGELIRIMGRVREKVLAEGNPSHENRETFRRLVESDLLRHLAAGDYAAAEKTVTALMGPDFSFTALGLDPRGEDVS